MTRPGGIRRRWARRWFAPAAFSVKVAGGCSAGGSAGDNAVTTTAAPLPTPLATSISGPAGTWATVAMGQLDQPLNTFWQLLYRPAGGSQWSNQVEATAVATNGGMVLAPLGGKSVVAGMLPSNRLTFTPMIATSDGGRSWQDGLIDPAVASTPDSLASNGAGRIIALVGDGRSSQVLAATDSLSTWETAATEAQLAATPAGRRCGLISLTAVAYPGTTPMAAGSCAKPGITAVFALGPTGWQAAGPPTSADSTVQVLGVRTEGDTLTGLFASTTPTGSDHLVAGWSSDAGQQWTTSPLLQVAGNQQITSFGPADGAGLFVLSSDPSGSNQLDLITGPSSSWSQLPQPPGQTATVAITAGDPPQALSVKGRILTIWTLISKSGGWSKSQTIPVNIQFGSSG